MSETKSYELKALSTKHVFSLVRVIKKFGIEQFKDCFFNPNVQKLFTEQTEEGQVTDKALEAVGIEVAFDIANIVIQNITECENEIYDFLSQVSNLSKKKIEDMPMNEFFEMIIDVIQKDEFKDFFTLVSRFLK